jgi:hypothetical protein
MRASGVIRINASIRLILGTLRRHLNFRKKRIPVTGRTKIILLIFWKRSKRSTVTAKNRNRLSDWSEVTILTIAPAKKTNEEIIREVPRIVECHCKTCGEVARRITKIAKNQRAFLLRSKCEKLWIMKA